LDFGQNWISVSIFKSNRAHLSASFFVLLRVPPAVAL
jgi:hypothetical protein